MNGLGFADPAAAKRVLQRLRLRNKLREIGRLVPALLHVLDHGRDPNGSAATPFAKRCIDLAFGDFEGRVGSGPIDLVEREHMSEQQLLQGADLVLQFLNAALESLGHGQFSIGTSHEGIAAGEPAQPISAGAK